MYALACVRLSAALRVRKLLDDYIKEQRVRTAILEAAIICNKPSGRPGKAPDSHRLKCGNELR